MLEKRRFFIIFRNFNTQLPLMRGGLFLSNQNGSIRVSNSMRILDLLIDKELSRVELAYETGLTKTTIGEIVREFLEIGFIEESKNFPTGVGRPSINLKIAKDFANVIGVGILRDNVNGCLINAQGDVLYTASCSFSEGKPKIETVYEVIDNLISKVALTKGKVEAIGLGIPGPLDTEKGIIKKPPKLSGFDNFPIIDSIKKRYNVFACLENDADMGAIGEKYYGKGKGLSSFIYILYDKGIGSGVVINNNLYHGLYGYAGEIGQTPLLKDGKFEYFENEYGTDSIIRKVSNIISRPIKNFQELETLSNVERNEIKGFIKELSEHFAVIILSLIYYFGISNIFIDGRMKYLGSDFLDQLIDIVRTLIFHEHEIQISLSDLGEYAISLGAAKFGLIKYLKKRVVEYLQEHNNRYFIDI